MKYQRNSQMKTMTPLTPKSRSMLNIWECICLRITISYTSPKRASKHHSLKIGNHAKEERKYTTSILSPKSPNGNTLAMTTTRINSNHSKIKKQRKKSDHLPLRRNPSFLKCPLFNCHVAQLQRRSYNRLNQNSKSSVMIT